MDTDHAEGSPDLAEGGAPKAGATPPVSGRGPDRSTWSGEQWAQYAAELASEGVEDAVRLLVESVRGHGKARNIGQRLQAADRILDLVSRLKAPQQKRKPKAELTPIDFAKAAEALRLERQEARRRNG